MLPNRYARAEEKARQLPNLLASRASVASSMPATGWARSAAEADCVDHLFVASRSVFSSSVRFQPD
jgi:hypothetical protein